MCQIASKKQDVHRSLKVIFVTLSFYGFCCLEPGMEGRIMFASIVEVIRENTVKVYMIKWGNAVT